MWCSGGYRIRLNLKVSQYKKIYKYISGETTRNTIIF